MPKRILVTGSDGFTGGYLCKELGDQGWEVWGSGLQKTDLRSRYVHINLLKPSSLEVIKSVIQPEVVIHLAAASFVAEADGTSFYKINLIGTKHLLDTLVQCPRLPDHVILPSSATVYGNATRGMIDETSTLDPVNDYGVSKLATEYLSRTYCGALPITITRPFNYTGVGQDTRFLVPKLVQHFKDRTETIELGNLQVSRDFSDVRTVAKVYSALALKGSSCGTLNICSGVAICIGDILNMMKSITGHQPEIQINQALVRGNEIESLYGSCRRLEEAVGDLPKNSFEETLDWMLSHT